MLLTSIRCWLSSFPLSYIYKWNMLITQQKQTKIFAHLALLWSFSSRYKAGSGTFPPKLATRSVRRTDRLDCGSRCKRSGRRTEHLAKQHMGRMLSSSTENERIYAEDFAFRLDPRKSYFWHKDYINQLTSYSSYGSLHLAVRMVAISKYAN